MPTNLDDLSLDQIRTNLEQAGHTFDPSRLSSFSENQLMDNFKSTLNEQLNVADLGNQTRPQLNRSAGQRRRNAQKNVDAAGLNVSNFLSKARQGTVTEQDLAKQEVDITSQLLDFIKGKESKSKKERELSQEFGVEGDIERINQLEGELSAEQRALENAKRRLFEEGGLTKEQLQNQTSELERVSYQKQADIAILANVANNDLQTAFDLIDYRLDLEFGDQEEQFENFQLQVQAVEGLSSSIKQRLQDEAAEQEQQLKEQRAFKQDIYQLAVEAQGAGQTSTAQQLFNMAQGEVDEGVYDSALNAALSAGVFLPKAKSGGGTSGSLIGLIDKETFRAQEEARRAEEGRGITLAPSTVDSLYEDYIRQAKFAQDLDFTDTERKKILQAGLADADLQAQLDHLYGDGEDATPPNRFAEE